MFLLMGVISSQAAPTVTNTADAGFGSLRQAILAATAGSTINFAIPTSDPGYDIATNRFTITLASSLPVISITVNIDNFPTTNPGVTVKGNNTFRILTLADSAVVIINNLTISNGSSNGVLDLAKGGGIFMGNSAVLTLNNCIVTANTATGGGGGIWMNPSGVLHVFDSTISNNTTTGGDGGGIRISNSGTLNITRSTVSGNQATATAPAGGGGGIYNGVAGTVNAENITVSGNTAGNQGGGINNNATVSVSSSTISGNTAAVGGGGIFNGPTFTATLANSLVALNMGGLSPDLLGTFTANSCLIGNADGSTISGANNQLGTTAIPINPLLGPLQNNGGPTFTRALLAGSPAIDRGATALATDQRGISRPQPLGGQPDIGAFEVKTTTAAGVEVSGRVLTSEGRGLLNARVTMTDQNGQTRSVITGKRGIYSFADVEAGQTYVVRVRSRRFNYSSRVLQVMDNITDFDFRPEEIGQKALSPRNRWQ